MEWELEVDGKKMAVKDVSQLEVELQGPELWAARSLVLERVKRRQIPRWEKIVYRLLGLRSPESEARGTLEVSLSSKHALVVFIRNDNDDGVVGIREQTTSGRIEFVTPAGEKFMESASQCISRDAAFSAIAAFMRTGKRPTGLIWQPAGERKR